MTNQLIKITNDLFDVAARLKSVNENYVVYYNVAKRRYEVYDGDSFAFVVPYPELDCRTVDYARKTAKQNADRLFEEIERNNQAVARQSAKDIISNTLNKFDQRRFYESY